MIVAVLERELPNGDWREIPGFKGYFINTSGVVYRRCEYKTTGSGFKLIQPTSHYQGYREIKLLNGEKRKAILVHRLVMLAFVGEPDPGVQVNHINGIKDDNRLENLEYCTASQNSAHAERVLNRPHPTKTEYRKLNEAKVRGIRTLLASGKSVKSVASIYGVTRHTIRRIRDGKFWKFCLSTDDLDYIRSLIPNED